MKTFLTISCIVYTIWFILYSLNLLKIKIIKQGNKWFMIRFTFYLKKGSIKLHIILRDDTDELHTHPWDFKSFLIIPYKEFIRFKVIDPEYKYVVLNHKVFSVVDRTMSLEHRTFLYKIFGISIPAITIGRYYEKKQLCSFCKELGYCKSNK